MSAATRPRPAPARSMKGGVEDDETVTRLHRRIAELEAIVAVQERRLRGGREATISLGGLEMRLVDRRSTLDGQVLALLPREYAILVELVRAGGNIVDRAAIENSIWGETLATGKNALAVHVSRLRRKLHGGTVGIATVRGVGYGLVRAAAEADCGPS